MSEWVQGLSSPQFTTALLWTLGVLVLLLALIVFHPLIRLIESLS